VQDKRMSDSERLPPELIGDLDAQQVINVVSCLPEKVAQRKIRRIIFDKLYRPKNPVEQYWLLRWIGDQTSLSRQFQFYSKIAASYKSMEAYLDVEARYMISEIIVVIDGCNTLNRSDDTREDRVQLIFSALTVLWHLYLFLGMREEFFQVCERGVRILDGIDDSQIGPSFYATCTNVSRCMAVAYLAAILKDDNHLRDASIRGLKRSFMLAINNSFDHPKVFEEFMESTRIYHEIVTLRTKNTESLLRCAVRPEKPEKVTRLLENFRAFESELMQRDRPGFFAWVLRTFPGDRR
jgi:hypothetical protein